MIRVKWDCNKWISNFLEILILIFSSNWRYVGWLCHNRWWYENDRTTNQPKQQLQKEPISCRDCLDAVRVANTDGVLASNRLLGLIIFWVCLSWWWRVHRGNLVAFWEEKLQDYTLMFIGPLSEPVYWRRLLVWNRDSLAALPPGD